MTVFFERHNAYPHLILESGVDLRLFRMPRLVGFQLDGVLGYLGSM